LAKAGIGSARKALPKMPGPKPEFQGPLATGEVLQTPEGSAVPPKVPFNLPDAAAPEPPVAPAKAEAPVVAPVAEAGTANPHDFVPGIQDVAGNDMPGAKGQVHNDILATKAKDYDWQAANFEHTMPEGKGRGFYYKGKFVSREKAAELLGEKEPLQSERLIELQENAPKPAAVRPPPVEDAAGRLQQLKAFTDRTPEETGEMNALQAKSDAVAKTNMANYRQMVANAKTPDQIASLRKMIEGAKTLTPEQKSELLKGMVPAAPPPAAAPPASSTGLSAPVDIGQPAKPKKAYSGAAYQAAANEFRSLVAERGMNPEHGWIKNPDFVAPKKGTYADISSNTELQAAYRVVLDKLGIKYDRITEKVKAQALPALKAYLEKFNKMVDKPLEELPDGSTFTRAGEKHTVKGTTPDGKVTIIDGKKIEKDMGESIKIDPGSEVVPGAEEGFPGRESPDMALDQPESVAQQAARLEAEKAAALKKSQGAAVQTGAAKPLVGAMGDIGQRDMLGGGDLFSQEPKPAALETKEPWQMTRAEIIARDKSLWGEQSTEQGQHAMFTAHRKHVIDALREGKPVPPEVLKEYQDLKPAAPEKGEAPLGFGGGVGPPKRPAPPAADPTPGPAPATPEEVAAVQTQKTPGLFGSIAQGIKSLLLPSSKGPASLKAAELLGSKLGPMHQRGEASAARLRPFSRMFDRLGVDREGVAPADNKGIKFMSDMSQGRPLTGKFKAASDLVQRMFDARLAALEKAGAALQTIRENYFPGMWTRESRLAFNAAMERMGKDFDVNKATPEQRAAIKAQVDKFLEEGVGSEKDALGYLTRKPLAGRESFRKQKVFEDIMDAAEFGLRPISNNPIDLVMLKLAEMDKSIMAHEYFQDLKARGELRIINPYEEVPQGWVKLNDKYGTIYGKPTVTIPEYIDKAVYQGLLKVAAALGIKHERLMRFPPGPGQQALGLSYQGQNRILSRFGTETSVIAHEIGHQLDAKYGLWDFLTGGGRGSERTPAQKELRAIADETERGKKARKKEEKMAQVMEAYIHAPDKMREIAPTIFAKFDAFVKSTPELKAFADIKPGLALHELTGEKYVGLPIMGYRIVPEAHGEIANNYLSSSLYNNRYFGPLYKGWMAAANTLNQTQLGMGSAFHAGFTTGEAQISSGANVLKDIYGVLRGNRSAADLGKSIARTTVATIRTPIIGDQVLNAWRNPEGTINPRIAQVVRAAELGGGGFKMESGLRTEQSTKLLRDWYSSHRLRAAVRSPIALTELLAKPTMEYLVPRQKAGVFADLAWRIIEQNPGKALEELTPQFRQAWNRVDARLGQVRYDRLFINNTAKNVVQGLVRAPGWSGGTIAEIGGGFTDAGRFMSEWVKTGKLPENLPDRTAYVISLLTTVGATNAALTYAFTGTAPHGMDFFAFRTGHKDEQGRDERFLIPSYVKDMLAYARHPGETLLNKSHPLLSILSDIAKNKDYYGVEIRSPDESIAKQAGQTAAYVIKGFEPFWTRGARREYQRGADLLSPRSVAPFFGVMPAPRAVTQTPAESLAHDLMMQQIPSGARTREQADRAMAKAKLNQGTDYLVRTVKRLNATAAVRVWQKANDEERAKIGDEVSGKIRNSKTLSEAEKATLRKRMAVNGAPATQPPPWESFR
jgi:hypothetical protein